ncbi:MAG TPA: hypothetical protein VGP82_02580, partial [Ktedonobacterales bacterium]|nr:hypothetical protein [Ktedonobacterales bacterium]
GTAEIALPQSSATHLDATAQVGSISVSGWPATITQTGSGRSTRVDLNPQPTSTMTVRVDVGRITVVAH